jgi:hypothetical protein
MTAEYAALEARVAELERQMRHVLPAKIDAVSFGVGLVHEEIRQVRETQDIHTAALERLETRLDRHGDLLGQHGDMLSHHGDMLSHHGDMLTEILRRLPKAPA